MAFKVADCIKETTASTGSPISLGGAASGYKAFSSFMSVGDTTVISIRNSTDFETGLWEYTSANTLTRVDVYESTNANAAVSWAAGSKDVICGPLAHDYISSAAWDAVVLEQKLQGLILADYAYGDRLSFPNRIVDPFDDETDVDTAGSSWQNYEPTN